MHPIQRTRWSAAAAIAAGQWGIVTRRQLLACGWTAEAIKVAARNAQLVRVHRAVFGLGTAPTTPHARAMAAVLAAGSGALLSHRWGLWLWDLGRLPAGPVHVSAAVGRHGGAGYVIHRVRRLEADRTFGIPVTTPARTLADCAPQLDERQLRRAVNQAQVRRLTGVEDLLAQPALRSLVSEHGATRSVLEDLLLDLDLPTPRVNAMLHGVEVDFLYPDLRLVIEADGWTFHGSKVTFEDDHDKRLHLEAHGIRVVAVTWTQVAPRQRRRTVERLRSIIASRRLELAGRAA